MKKQFLVICLLTTQFCNAAIRYVRPTNAGLADGSSWSNASNDLQAIINASSTVNGDTIFVAAGVYTPNTVPPTATTPTSSKDYSFWLVPNVKIFGNFAGTESDLASRDLYNVSYKTVLSGDINGDDGENFTNISDNSFHVVIGSGAVGTAILDGFTISGGNSSGTSPIVVNGNSVQRYAGGGLFLVASSPTISNCVITKNSTGGGGSAGFFNTNSANATIVNCNFIGNNSPVNCGAMGNNLSSPKIIGCAFIGNKSGMNGGGMGNFNGSPTIVNCTFSGNNATSGGGGIYNSGTSSPTIVNTVIWGNNDGIVNEVNASANISYSLVQGLTATSNNNINGNANPLFTDAPSYTTSPFTTGDYQLENYSPCIDAGTTTVTGITLPTTDIEGNARIIGGTIDIGAYESFGTPLALTLVNFDGKITNAGALLQWEVTQLSDPASFNVEKSFDGITFTSAGTVTATEGINQYSFLDKFSANSSVYYRLHVKTPTSDFNTSIVALNSKTNNATVKIWPSPASQSFTIENNNPALIGTTAVITDISGHIIQKIQLSAIQKIDTHSWPAGIYFIKLTSGSVQKIAIK